MFQCRLSSTVSLLVEGLKYLKCWFDGLDVMLLLALGKMSSTFVGVFHVQPLGVKRQIKTGEMSVFRPKKVRLRRESRLRNWVGVYVNPIRAILKMSGPVRGP